MTDRERLLQPGGECAVCHRQVAERITVALVHGNSGPGWSRYGCLPCARELATLPFAPRWLAEDLAAVDRESS